MSEEQAFVIVGHRLGICFLYVFPWFALVAGGVRTQNQTHGFSGYGLITLGTIAYIAALNL